MSHARKHVPPRGNPTAKEIPFRTLAVVDGTQPKTRYNRSQMRAGPSGVRLAEKRARRWLS